MCSFLAVVPLVALLGLMHLGVSRLVGVLRRAGCADQRGIHDGARPQRKAAALQHPTDFGKQLLAQIVLLQQVAKLQHRGLVGHALEPQVDAHEATQAGDVVQRFFHGVVGQVEPVLQQVNAQHAFQTERRASIASLRVVRLDHRAQRCPRNDGIHRIEKVLALGASAKPLESRTLVGCHRKRLLLHPRLLAPLLCDHVQQAPGQET
jgi:hypothetical protein